MALERCSALFEEFKFQAALASSQAEYLRERLQAFNAIVDEAKLYLVTACEWEGEKKQEGPISCLAARG